jgi:hypothetical protein
MKTIYKIIFSLSIIALVASCEKVDDNLTFKGEAVYHFTLSSGSASHGAKSSADTYALGVGTTTAAAVTIQFSVASTSTAVEGVHYEAIPTSVSIGQGAFASSLTIVPLPEGITPGEPVTLVIDITNSTVEKQSLPQSFTLSLDRVCDPLPGDYRVVMHDSFADGWQTNDGNGGDGIQVTLDDGTVIEVGMCNPYVESPFTCAPGDFSNAEDVVTIPVGTTSASWYFPGDAYGEISFEIYGPDGTEVWRSPVAAGAGILAIVLCAP